MRVLHFIPTFWVGGIETLFLQWFDKAKEKGIEIELLTYKLEIESDLKKQFISNGGKCYEIEPIRSGYLFKYTKSIINFFKSHNDYDIMHVHGLSDYWCMKCAKKYGIKKIIFHVHNMKKEQEDNRSLKNILRNFYYSKGLNLVDVRMACSVEAAKSHFNNKTYTVINNAIDVEKYKLDFEKRRLYRNMFDVKNEKIFVHIGRMVKDKNYPFLINVFSEIHQIYPNAKFLLVGDGPEKGHVLELVKTAGIESNVVLLGIRNDIDCILQAADGMLLPSHTEGFGIVAIEAQASGLPCLISQNVPNSVMITPVAKQMNNNHSPREWAVAMVDLISNERQDQTTKVISAGFDSKGEADKLFMKYEELVNG